MAIHGRQHLTATAPYQLGSGTTGLAPVGYLSIEGASAYASVSTRTVKRWIRAGLQVYQGTARGKILIRPSDIDLYLQQKTVPKPELDLDAMVEDVLSGLGKPKSESMRPRAKWARA